MSVGTFLAHILIVLVAAKVAAEVSERIGLPAVVGEIIAGVIIGPSALHLIGGDEVLPLLGEIGVILLLLDVGLEMDIGEFRAVGRSSILVAITGIVVPMALGLGAMEVFFGDPFNTALFIGAALTATSVGITARVFGDLRALSSPEARTVLGAAVADDVMGLVVLTVVVRLVTEGSVSLAGIAGILGLALAFLVVGGSLGLRAAPPLFRVIAQRSRSGGTMVAIALAFALAFAKVAEMAKLAPIVGAFVAGLALARSDQSERIRRELAPIGHLFIPVFFLQIGAEAELSAFARMDVLRDASILLVIAVVGKLVAAVGAVGSPGDKWLIGIGMLPRGEVGLIFATIGRQQGVLDDDLFAALLLVVLATTLITPPLLRWRLNHLRTDAPQRARPSEAEPAGGWLTTSGSEVTLAAIPPDELALPLALEAARLMAAARPSPDLAEWLAGVPDGSHHWSSNSTSAFLRLLDAGNARSWRFLETVGLLDDAVPELADVLRRRHADPFVADPTAVHRWAVIERLRSSEGPIAVEFSRLDHPRWLLLAALLLEAMDGRPDAADLAGRVIERLELGDDAEHHVSLLVDNADLFWSLARRPESFSEESVLQIASHLDRPEAARALYVLSLALAPDAERWEMERVRELHELVQGVLRDPELTGVDARNLVQRRRSRAADLASGSSELLARVVEAPHAYVLSTTEDELIEHAGLLRVLPPKGVATVRVAEADGDRWRVSVAACDQAGLLAVVTRALASAGVDVREAIVAGWPDGGAIESFLVSAASCPDADQLRAEVESGFGGVLESMPLPDAEVSFDNSSSPWHTVCTVTAPDRPGLLHSLAVDFAVAGVEVRSARIGDGGGVPLDLFELTTVDGHKLAVADQRAVLGHVAAGVSARPRRYRSGWQARPAVGRAGVTVT